MVLHFEDAAFSDTYGGGGNVIGLDNHLVKPVAPHPNAESDTVLIFMHPTGGGMYLPIVGALAAAGNHVIWANSRYRGTDSALIMEKVAADLGQTIVDARDRLGYSKIILAGWSGGGSLSMWYQSLAVAGEGITDTAAGDPYVVPAERLPEVDAVMMLAAHISRHGTLTEWMDPSITDESEPFVRDPFLNLYDPANENQPPYSEEYLQTFRDAQIARNRDITAWVKDRLDEIRNSDEPNRELSFTVQGTMADPRWLDPAVDPNGRTPGECYLGDPKIVNDGVVGLARYSSLRSWLSQWSYDDARCDALKAAVDVTVPVLVVGNGADNACTPSHTHRLFDAVSHADAHPLNQMHEIEGASHYYGGKDGREHLAQAVKIITDFAGQVSSQ